MSAGRIQYICRKNNARLFVTYHHHTKNGFFNILKPCIIISNCLRNKFTTNENFNKITKHIETLRREYERSISLLQDDAGQTTGNDFQIRLAFLKPIITTASEIDKVKNELFEVNKMLDDISEKDGELSELAKHEKASLMQHLSSLEQQIESLILPTERIDNKDIILEVHAGVGGQEAMLFAADLFSMYKRYATYSGWTVKILHEESTTEQGGLRHGSLAISGQSVYGRLKYEGGVHRVQRVPVTEKSGRVHTSTATVAVLPQPSEIDVTIKPTDLKFETCRSSGKGGQHVNTSDTAVRIVHLPTGMSVECQTERSQMLNKATAMKILTTRLYQEQLNQQISKQQSSRKLQVGQAGRSEKIRTYNYGQDRITDHRLSLTVHGLNTVLSGDEGLDSLISRIVKEAKQEQLMEIIENSS